MKNFFEGNPRCLVRASLEWGRCKKVDFKVLQMQLFPLVFWD